MKKAGVLSVYLILAAIMALFFTTAAQAGCEKGDCSNGPGIYAWPDGATYTGAFLNGKFHGQGTYVWADGKKYVGAFKNDKRNGRGTYTWPNGASYTGEWENGQKSGYGIYTFPNGNKNIGLWESDKLSQEMDESEIKKFLAPPEKQPPVAATAAAQTPQNTDEDLEKQLAALGGQMAETPATGEESSLAVTEAAPAAAGPANAPFLISTRKLPLIDGSAYKTWENQTLLAVGPINPVGRYSVMVDTAASDKNAGTIAVNLRVENSSGCPLMLKGYLQAGDYYAKVVSWSGDQAIAPGSRKEALQTVVLDKEAPRSKISFKLQGAGCAQ